MALSGVKSRMGNWKEGQNRAKTLDEEKKVSKQLTDFFQFSPKVISSSQYVLYLLGFFFGFVFL